MNSEKKKAIGFILMSAAGFAVMNLCVRMAGDLPSFQKAFFRNVVALFCALAVVRKQHVSLKPPAGTEKYMFLRCAVGSVGIFSNFYAVDHLNISDASLLNKLSPFFAVIFSYLLMKEKVHLRQGMAIFIAFIGLLLVVRPGFNTTSLFPYFIGMLGGMGAGGAYTFVRKLGTMGVKGPIIVFWFSAFSCVAAIPFFITRFGHMGPRQILFLLGAGAAASVAQFSITAAYRHAPARDISIFEYSQIIFTAVLGFVFLGQMPDAFSLAGYAVIIFAAAFSTFGGNKKENAK